MESVHESAGHLRIMVIAHAFPPMNTTASFRPYSWIKTWSRMGHEVCVVTTQKYGFDGSMDLEMDMKGLDVHVVPYLWNKKVSVNYKGEIRGKSIQKWERLRTYTRRLRFGFGMFLDLRMLSFGPLVRKGTELLADRKFDFIISTYPPDVIHLVGYRLSKLSRVPWIADYRDLWFREMRLYQFRVPTFVTGLMHRRLLKRARLISIVSQGLSDKLQIDLERDSLVSYNGFARKDSGGELKRPWADSKKHIVYAGRLYPGKRDPKTLFQAMVEFKASTPGFDNQICADFYGYDVSYLKRLVEGYGLRDCVRIHGFVPHETSLAAQRNADALLFLDWSEKSAEGILTGKLFEYLISGRPIMCVGTRKDTEAAKIIEKCGCGAAVSSVEEIKAYLGKLLNGSIRIDPNYSEIESYSRDHQARLLLDAIVGAL
jgi:glycosyltransferase involved in cell wall biosynthesis